ncbi:hypothetical protein ACR820_30040 [Streptomyces netropsis]
MGPLAGPVEGVSALLRVLRPSRDQFVEEVPGLDQGVPRFLRAGLAAHGHVHPAVAVDLPGVVDGERIQLFLEPLTAGEAPVLRQPRQQRVGLRGSLPR